MQIRITDFRLDTAVEALTTCGFGLVETRNPLNREIETIHVWTERDADGLPCGYEVGLVRREVSSFARYEIVLETNRIETPTLMATLEAIAKANR